MPYLREFRQAQTLAELDRLRDDLTCWTKLRTECDRRGQYSSQIAAIGKEISDAIEALRAAVVGASDGSATGELFRRLAADDRRIIWVRSAWDYFRHKFDQRDDPALQPVLRAADEVIWSCYKPFFGNSAKLPPAPLCCIDASYVPNSVRPDQAAHQLERTSEMDEGPLASYLRALPIPILRLPAGIASSPWALALIGHETGHFIQRMIEDAAGFFDWTSTQIAAAVDRAGGGEADKSAWRRCTEEIFADWYFVLTMGSWAVWAIAPWTVGPDAVMLTRQRYYPSPAVRLRLLASFAEALGLQGAEELRLEIVSSTVLSAASEETKLDLRIADEVAKVVSMEIPDGRGVLTNRIVFRATDFDRNKVVDNWSRALMGKTERDDDNELRTARLVTAAAVKSSYEIAQLEGEEERVERMLVLRKETPKRIAACFEKGVRAAPRVLLEERKGPALARIVLDASEEMLLR